MKSYLPATIILLTFMLSIIDCSGSSRGQKDYSGFNTKDMGEIIATVNGMNIGTKDLDYIASRTPGKKGEEIDLAKKKELLEQLISDTLVYQEALDKGYDKDPRIKKMMINSLLRKEIYSSLKSDDITEEEMKKYYEQHKEEFIIPEKVRVKRILIKPDEKLSDADAKKEAERIRGELAKDVEKWKEYATKYSKDPFARRGGDMGYMSKDGRPGVDPEIVEKAFTLEINEVSDVFKTNDGYNIIVVTAKREKTEKTFEQTKGSIQRRMKNELQKKLYDDFVAKLRKKAQISINEDVLKKYQLKREPMKPPHSPTKPPITLKPSKPPVQKETDSKGSG